MIAPAAGAARRAPKPSGPDLKMSLAKIGNSAVGLPSTTANRSSRMAPSTTFWRPMKATPLNMVFRSKGSRRGGARSTAMASITTAADSQSTAHAANASAGSMASSTPPSAGPATTAACAAELDAAIARGRAVAGTMLVSTDCRLGCSKARPAPTTNAIASTSADVS